MNSVIASLSFLIIVAWIFSIIFVYRTLGAPVEKQEIIKKKLRAAVFYTGVAWWMGRPERERDPKERALRNIKYRQQIGTLAVESIIVVLVMTAFGAWAAYDGIYDISAFFLLVLAPFAGLFSLYLGLLWYLLKKEYGRGAVQ